MIGGIQSGDTVVRVVQGVTEREAVFRLRYAVYVEEMGRNQCYADHERCMIQEPMDTAAHLLAAWRGGEIVGTVRVNVASDPSTEGYGALYELERFAPFFPDGVALITKLMVEPSARSAAAVAIKLARACMEFGSEAGIEFGVIDCNDYLVEYFASLGFRRYTEAKQHPEYGLVYPMFIAPSETEYLQRLRSPLLIEPCRQSQNLNAVALAQNLARACPSILDQGAETMKDGV